MTLEALQGSGYKKTNVYTVQENTVQADPNLKTKNDESYFCKHCNKRFKNSSSLTRHFDSRSHQDKVQNETKIHASAVHLNSTSVTEVIADSSQPPPMPAKRRKTGREHMS